MNTPGPDTSTSLERLQGLWHAGKGIGEAVTGALDRFKLGGGGLGGVFAAFGFGGGGNDGNMIDYTSSTAPDASFTPGVSGGASEAAKGAPGAGVALHSFSSVVAAASAALPDHVKSLADPANFQTFPLQDSHAAFLSELQPPALPAAGRGMGAGMGGADFA